MPILEINIPTTLLRVVRILAEYEGIDANTFVLLALAEKIGEVKARIIDKAITKELGDPETLVQRYPTVIWVTPTDDFKLNLKFSGGLEGTFDVKPLIARKGVFSGLGDPELFIKVQIAESGDYVHWADEISIGADTLYYKILFEE